jgi:hypothetical protein
MRGDRGQASDRFWVQFSVGVESQPAWALRDQDAVVGQEGHAPGMLETLGKGHDAEIHRMRAGVARGFTGDEKGGEEERPRQTPRTLHGETSWSG